jgi:hypothetical protein
LRSVVLGVSQQIMVNDIFYPASANPLRGGSMGRFGRIGRLGRLRRLGRLTPCHFERCKRRRGRWDSSEETWSDASEQSAAETKSVLTSLTFESGPPIRI